MTPGRHDFEIRRGSSKTWAVQFKTVVDGVESVLDLTGAVAELSLRLNNSTLRKTSPDDMTIDLVLGRVTWEMTPEDTRQFPDGRVTSYELELQWPGGEQKVYLEGYFIGRGGLSDD